MAELMTLARPYAKAVFANASDAQDFDKWSKDLQLLSAVLKEESIKKLLTHPSASCESKQKLLLDVVGSEIAEPTSRLIVVLAENDRLLVLPLIHELYEELRSHMQKVVDARVVSALELDDKQVALVVESLKKRLNSDIRVTQEIDESLIGGIVIHAGDMVIDGSVKGKISKLAEAMNS